MRFRVATWFNTETEKEVYVIEARLGRGQPWSGVVDGTKVLAFDDKTAAKAEADRLNVAAKADGNYSS